MADIALNFAVGKAFQNNTSIIAALRDGDNRPPGTSEPATRWFHERQKIMSDEDPVWNENNPTLDDFVQRLVDETGISEAQALELIYLIGLNWSSLMREAKVIASQG